MWGLGRARGQELRALADAVVGAHDRDRRRRRGGREARDSSGRRKTAGHGWEGRPEAEAARTRAGGLHRVGAYAQTERKRDTPRWSGRPVT